MSVSSPFLNGALRALRLRLARRVRWLRSYWQHDPLRDYQAMVISDDQADWLLTGDDSAAEAQFYQQDETAAALTKELKALEAARPEPGEPFERLCTRFGLTQQDQELLLLALAPALDPSFLRLYAYVQDDLGRTYPTSHLAGALFGEDVRERLAPTAPLRRYRLLWLEPATSPAAPELIRPIAVDERVIGYLGGDSGLDPAVASFVKPVQPPVALAASHQALAERLAGLLKAEPGPRAVWLGPDPAGARPVAAAVCRELGLELLALDLPGLAQALTARPHLAAALTREAMLLPAACYVESEDVKPGSPEERLLTSLDLPLFLGGRDPVRALSGALSVPLEEPSPSEQVALWEAMLPPGVAGEADLRKLAQHFRFGPEEIAGAIETALRRARLRHPEGGRATADDLWEACREAGRAHLGDLAQRMTGRTTWAQIILPPDTLAHLKEIAAQVEQRYRVYQEWGFAARLGKGLGIAALFSGPSGTGKSMAAEVLANHLRLDLYRVDLAGVISKYIGETEKNLRRIFDAAERSGAILFFDEADALFGKRTEVRDSHDRYANIEVNYLLQRMEEYRGLTILATNMKTAVDPAFLRRLRFLVEFPLPDAARRLAIWEQLLPPEREGLDLPALARLEMAGGHIRNIALGAAFLAAREERAVRMTDIVQAIRREYAKSDRPVRESDLAPLMRR